MKRSLPIALIASVASVALIALTDLIVLTDLTRFDGGRNQAPPCLSDALDVSSTALSSTEERAPESAARSCRRLSGVEALVTRPQHVPPRHRTAPIPLLTVRDRFRRSRTRRVVFLILAVLVLNGFDLFFTLLASAHGHFVEMNPVAARLLSGPQLVVIAYKAGLVLAGCSILLALRRHAVAELACWFLLAANVYVAARWSLYYQYLFVANGD
jgi:hypothetical protein